MRCDAVREAISARLDDEAAASPIDVDAHLAACAGCRGWQELAHIVTRRTRLGGPLPPPDLTSRLLVAVEADTRRRRTRRQWLAVARAVIGAGLLQLLATVPLLVMARDRTSGGARVHVLGLVELTIGAGFFVGAVAVLWRERGQSPAAVTPTRGLADAEHGDPSAGVSEVA